MKKRWHLSSKWMINHSMLSIFSFSFTESNLHLFRLFLKIWAQLDQSHLFAFQSMYDSQNALIKLGWERGEYEGDLPSKRVSDHSAQSFNSDCSQWSLLQLNDKDKYDQWNLLQLDDKDKCDQWDDNMPRLFWCFSLVRSQRLIA